MNFLLKAVASFAFVLVLNSAAKQLEPQARLINGTPIAITQAPYQASIRLKAIEQAQGYGAGEICSGAVVSQRMIITAAYCIMNFAASSIKPLSASDFTVVMGSINRYEKSENTLQYDVLQVTPNPQYNEISSSNDIGVMFINGYIPWNATVVKAIPLNFKEIAVGTNCMVTGWEHSENNETLLMSLTAPVLSNVTCAGITLIDVPQSLLCAGSANFSGVNSCAGDAGDPLVCNDLLSGIVSKNNGCGLPNYPGYYTNISNFYDWIVSVNNSFDYNYYSGGVSKIERNIYLFIVNVALVLSILNDYVWF